MLKKAQTKIVPPSGLRAILETAIPWAFDAIPRESGGKLEINYGGSRNHKGERGRIAIIGGSRDYTGAPYFAAISAMKLGCDLSYVICASGASQTIKSYSPELIVMPLLDSPDLETELDCLLSRLHVLVIGPGLGRDKKLQTSARIVLLQAKKRRIPIVIDADGLLLVNEDLNLIRNYNKSILTPNRIELERLLNSVYKSSTKPYKISSMSNEEIKQSVLKCSNDLQVTILSKGPTDIIADPTDGFYLETPHNLGSDRRCGGQGDLLSGMTAVFYHWISSSPASSSDESKQLSANPNHAGVYSGYLASMVTRYCNHLAFERFQHSALSKDMIEEIHLARRWLLSDFIRG